MKISLSEKTSPFDLKIIPVFQLAKDKKPLIDKNHVLNQQQFSQQLLIKNFKAEKGEILFTSINATQAYVFLGLGEREKTTSETLRRNLATLVRQLKTKSFQKIELEFSSFTSSLEKIENKKILKAIVDAFTLTSYEFNKYKPVKKVFSPSLHVVVAKNLLSELNTDLHETMNVAESINLIKDWINETPQTLHSEQYAKLVEQDAKKLKQVKIKILNKKQIQAEKMNLVLAVNAGSYYEPRLVQLTYTPTKKEKFSKHICLVGKGITFDTGGYSLKPAASMTGMKFDMGGSATVYGAFRALALNKCPHQVTCLMILTDNVVGPTAIFPDCVVTARNGKTVEILNTDAEGRLVLADTLDYACDLKPTHILDAATLTGACLVALGKEVCAVLGNDNTFIDQVKNAAKEADEYIWQLPIIDEYRDDIKSKIADIKNIGSPMRAGTALGAAFLEHFISKNIAWAHLDIAGVCDDQSHLAYCGQGASGLTVRTIYELIQHGMR